jgi:hypothetical protein
MAALAATDRLCYAPFPFTGAAKSGTFPQRGPNLWCGIRVPTEANGLQVIASITITCNRIRPALPSSTPQPFSFIVASRRLMGICGEFFLWNSRAQKCLLRKTE